MAEEWGPWVEHDGGHPQGRRPEGRRRMIAHPLNPAQCAYLALSVVLLIALAWVWLTMEDDDA